MAKSSPARAPRRSRATPVRPAIVVHSLAQAVAALRAAASLGVPVELWSAEGAAGYAGAGWFKAVVEGARASVPRARFPAVLDCADMAGYALGAFRIGLPAVCFIGPARVATKLADIAARQRSRVVRRRPRRVLDLRHVDDPEGASRAWLGGS